MMLLLLYQILNAIFAQKALERLSKQSNCAD